MYNEAAAKYRTALLREGLVMPCTALLRHSEVKSGKALKRICP